MIDLIEKLKAAEQNTAGMFEIDEDTICQLMSFLQAIPSAISVHEAIDNMENHEICTSINVAYKHGWNDCRKAVTGV